MTSADHDIDITDIDLFSGENLTDPYPIYRRLRDTGASVWVSALECWAVPRYDDVRASLQDWETYSSAQGVGMNDDINELSGGTVLASDPPLHDQLRGVLADRLGPRAIRSLSGPIREQADALVESLVERGTFDAVTDLARVFPPTIIADLVGLPGEIRPQLLEWGDAVFNTLGPLNDRSMNVMPVVGDQFQWLYSLDGSELREGSMGRAIFDAADAGLISRESAPALLSAYTSASMDTTVNALGSAVALFA
ncbi:MULTISPECIES: cytochrome P450 [unclassified Rhodococcus (in: high G+C Gram-positive bacteria)]|nr:MULTISPECIES: cytochrome P450 [unclassified Rhodococcus (in: high G+C Gram-positive bacteria)]